MRKINPILYDRLKVLIAAMGYELWGGELLSGSQRAIFRLYIDSARGITSDDCSAVSRQVGALMDVEDPIQGKYILEVSSPGIDKPLFEKEHYQKYVGSQVKIRLHAVLHGKRQFVGVLRRMEGEDIYLLVEGQAQEVKLPFSDIEKANLIGDIRL